MEHSHDPQSILEHLQTLLQQIKRLATYAYTESNAFALTLLNRKRLELEDELMPLMPEAPVQVIHQSRTMKAILLCYKPVHRKLKAIDKSLETYYRDGLAGLQREVEALIAFVGPVILKVKVS